MRRPYPSQHLRERLRQQRGPHEYEDWLLYLELHHAGHHGAVIPERLIRYRVRDKSMIRRRGAAPSQALRGAQGPPARAGDQLDRAERVSIAPRRQYI